MALESSEIPSAASENGGPAGSVNPIRSPLRDQTPTGDLDLRSVVEENAFQSLSEGTLIRRPRFTHPDSGANEDNDFRFMTFPRKLWKIVGSTQFKSIWWDENGTSIVINEEHFKREVLERKGPFKIFETGSMKSLVRQLNLYGFSKLRQAFQRSASLRDFLAEEKEVSVLSKLQFYQNPNFKRGCPQLLVRMKRRVGIKSVYPASAFVRDFSSRHFEAEGNLGSHHSGLVADPRGESTVPASTKFNPPFSRKPSASQRTAHKNAPLRSDFALPPSPSARPSEPVVMDQRAVLNQLTTFHMRSTNRYSQENSHIVNLITATTSNSQYYIISHLQRSYLEMAEPSASPTRFPDLAVNTGPFSEPATSKAPVVPKPRDS